MAVQASSSQGEHQLGLLGQILNKSGTANPHGVVEQVLANLESTPIVPGHRCPASATHPYRAPQGDDMRHQTFWIVALTKR